MSLYPDPPFIMANTSVVLTTDILRKLNAMPRSRQHYMDAYFAIMRNPDDVVSIMLGIGIWRNDITPEKAKAILNNRIWYHIENNDFRKKFEEQFYRKVSTKV